MVSPFTGFQPFNAGLGGFNPQGAASFPNGFNPSGGGQSPFGNSGFPGQAGPGFGGFPSPGGFPSGGFPSSGFPSGGFPSGGFPSSGFPSGGFPSGGFPSSGFPQGGFGGFPSFPQASPASFGQSSPFSSSSQNSTGFQFPNFTQNFFMGPQQSGSPSGFPPGGFPPGGFPPGYPGQNGFPPGFPPMGNPQQMGNAGGSGQPSGQFPFGSSFNVGGNLTIGNTNNFNLLFMPFMSGNQGFSGNLDSSIAARPPFPPIGQLPPGQMVPPLPGLPQQQGSGSLLPGGASSFPPPRRDGRGGDRASLPLLQNIVELLTKLVNNQPAAPAKDSTPAATPAPATEVKADVKPNAVAATGSPY